MRSFLLAFLLLLGIAFNSESMNRMGFKPASLTQCAATSMRALRSSPLPQRSELCRLRGKNAMEISTSNNKNGSYLHELSPEDVKKIEEDLMQFHDPTTSSLDSPRPIIVPDWKEQKLLIARIDCFRMLNRYFAFDTNEHVNALVKAVQEGHGMYVYWYYLKEPRKHPLIKISSIKR